MTKLTLSVCKAYKNSGRFRIHKENTSKHWKHYFVENYFDDGDWKFSSEWVSAFKAMILKRNQFYKKIFVCLECGRRFSAYVPKNTSEYKDECPFCGE